MQLVFDLNGLLVPERHNILHQLKQKRSVKREQILINNNSVKGPGLNRMVSGITPELQYTHEGDAEGYKINISAVFL